jgi:hypothetical protein
MVPPGDALMLTSPLTAPSPPDVAVKVTVSWHVAFGASVIEPAQVPGDAEN